MLKLASFMASFLSRWRKKRFIESSLIKAGPVLSVREGEVVVVTYTSAADKMRIFSVFIREGIESDDRVIYTYPDEESEIVRRALIEHGIDVEKHERDGTLIMRSLTEDYMPDGNFDIDRAIERVLNDRAEAKRKGCKHIRELIDLGDFSFLKGDWQTYMKYWNDTRWIRPSGPDADLLSHKPFTIVLAAVNVEDIGEVQLNEIRKAFLVGHPSAVAFIDLLEYADAFSKFLGMSHQKLVGRKFLLEFDPTSAYERIVEDFAREALANLEPAIIFTSSTSAVRACLARQHAVKFFLMSISTSTPELTSENDILLPAKNTALILDSFSKVLEKYAKGNVFLVFDSLSELVGLVGFEKTYMFLRYALDMLSPARTTTLFLFNTSAHEPQVVSGIRGLFHNQLTYEKNRLTVAKIS